MLNAILVPIDFTPVSLNALNYACALRNNDISRVVAVHLLGPNIANGGIDGTLHHNAAFLKVFMHMQHQILEKTTADLQNFVYSQREAGVDIQPLVEFGTIYDSFAAVADDEGALLTIVGTHGIVGLQHLTGSRAYKTVASTGKPFLVVQTKPYTANQRWYLVFKDNDQFCSCAAQLAAIMCCLSGEFVINIVAGSSSLPPILNNLSSRIRLTTEPLTEDVDIMERAAMSSATAVGYCIDALEENDTDVYGISQARIMANEQELPVLCLTAAGLLAE